MKKNVIFLENFSELLGQGYTVEQSLTLSQHIFHLSFYNHFIDSLSQGEDIYDLLLDGDFPSVFKNYLSFYRNKGYLSDAIRKSLKIYKTQNAFIDKLKKQLTYPLLLILFLFCFSLFILIFLLPQVDILFASFSIEVNYLTTVMFLFFRLFPYVFIVTFIMIMSLSISLIYSVKKKKYRLLDKFMIIPMFNMLLKKYFSLKFALIYNELSLDNIDTSSIIQLLNEQMCDEDIKLLLYEMKKLLNRGEHIEDILVKLKYFDPLLISFFQISLYNNNKKDAISFYIETTYHTIDMCIENFIKMVIPIVYCFVSFFVIGIYITVIVPLMSGFSNI